MPNGYPSIISYHLISTKTWFYKECLILQRMPKLGRVPIYRSSNNLHRRCVIHYYITQHFYSCVVRTWVFWIESHFVCRYSLYRYSSWVSDFGPSNYPTSFFHSFILVYTLAIKLKKKKLAEQYSFFVLFFLYFCGSVVMCVLLLCLEWAEPFWRKKTATLLFYYSVGGHGKFSDSGSLVFEFFRLCDNLREVGGSSNFAILRQKKKYFSVVVYVCF